MKLCIASVAATPFLVGWAIASGAPDRWGVAPLPASTLTAQVARASMVLYGTLANAKEAGEEGEGSTDLIIDAVVKDNPIRGNRKTITLARYVRQPTVAGYKKSLVFCDVSNGKIVFSHSVAAKADSDLPKYLQLVVAAKDKKPTDRLRFFFDYLENPDWEVSFDAHLEFAYANYKDYRDMATTLSAEKIVGWLKSKSTPDDRYGLYASMLGHCGKPEHTAVLLSLPLREYNAVGILTGYVMLKPQEGWKYLRGILSDSKKDFQLRYAALRAACFFRDSRPDIIPEKDVVSAVAILLDHSDLAFYAVEVLREWRQWQMADKVLALQSTPVENAVLHLNSDGTGRLVAVHWELLRFALSCEERVPAAKAYVAEQRRKDGQAVADAEKWLKMEQARPTPAVKPAFK